MSVNDDLARWGEPPADRDELALAELLGALLDQGPASLRHSLTRSPAGMCLLEASGWVECVTLSVVAHAELAPALAPAPQGPPPVQPATLPPVELRLRLWREKGPLLAPATTGTVLRDLRRVPAG